MDPTAESSATSTNPTSSSLPTDTNPTPPTPSLLNPVTHSNQVIPTPLSVHASSSQAPLHLASPVKLDRNNYLIWRVQVLSSLIGNNLDGFITNAKPCPPRLIEHLGEDKQARIVNNPDYALWIRQDQLIFSWLMSTMTEGLAGKVVRCTTAHEIWKTIEGSFGSQSRARTLQLKNQLQTTKKGSLSISDFFDKMKGFADSLSIAGSPLSDDDLMLNILNGLPADYDSIIVNITARLDHPSLEEVYALLLTQEMRLEHYSSVPSVDVQTTLSANVAYSTSSTPNQRRFTNNNNRNSNTFYPRSNQFHNNNRHRGRGRGRNNNRPTCQICYKQGHLADVCYFRRDENFVPNHTPPSPPISTQAFVAGPEAPIDTNWLMDSGASNHITNDLSNLNFHSEYSGPERVMVGNGQGLRIGNVGNERGEASSSSRAI